MFRDMAQALDIQRNDALLQVILDPMTGQMEELEIKIRKPISIKRRKKREAFDGFYKTFLSQSSMILVSLKYQVEDMEAIIVLECGVQHPHNVTNRLSGRNSSTRKWRTTPKTELDLAELKKSKDKKISQNRAEIEKGNFDL